MNRDKAKGKLNEIAGRSQQKVGKLTGSRKTQLEGALRQTKGELQQLRGGVKDAAKRIRDRAERDEAPRVTTRTRTVRTTTTTRKR